MTVAVQQCFTLAHKLVLTSGLNEYPSSGGASATPICAHDRRSQRFLRLWERPPKWGSRTVLA